MSASDDPADVTLLPLASPAQLAMLEDMPSDSSVTISKPTLKFERAAIKRGARFVCGVDEVGRGPLAGPVVVSAVILNHRKVPGGLNDSKVLTAAQREALYEKIMATAIVSIAVAPPAIIAELNILQASLWAMRKAVLGLQVKADHILIDGNKLPKDLPCPGEAIVEMCIRDRSMSRPMRSTCCGGSWRTSATSPSPSPWGPIPTRISRRSARTS